jgi:hypothetical protein
MPGSIHGFVWRAGKRNNEEKKEYRSQESEDRIKEKQKYLTGFTRFSRFNTVNLCDEKDAETVAKRCATLASFPQSGNKAGMTDVTPNLFRGL